MALWFFIPPPSLRWQNSSRLMVGLNCLQPFGFGHPYSNGGNDATVMPDARLTKIRDTGFDFVRLCIDPETLLAADSASNITTTELDARIAEVMTGIGRRTALGLKVMVDMHFHGDTVSFAAGWQWDDVLDGLAGTKFIRLKFVSARLATAINAAGATTCLPSMVCYELFNEPPNPSTISTANWISHQNALWAAVRAVMPSHTIVAAGNNLNNIDSVAAGGVSSGLTALTASNFDVNTGFAIHPYESGVFSHQGVDGSIYQYMHGLTFPAASHAGGAAAAKTSFSDAATAEGNHDGVVAADAVNAVVTQSGWSSSIDEFFATYGSKALLATRMAVATTWASGGSVSNKRIFNTEFGVKFAHASDDATDAAAAAFITAVRELSSEAGINSICIHEMQGSDFGIQNTSTPWAFNSSIEAALFVTPPGSVNYSFTGGSLPGGVTLTRATTGTYVNSSGVLSSAAIDAARFDHDIVTLAAKGLLVEPARTNLLLMSEATDDAAWTLFGTAQRGAANGAVAPDGATTADAINYIATLGGQFYQTINLTAVPYAISTFAKRNLGSNQLHRLKGQTASATDSYSTDFTATAAWQRFMHNFTSTQSFGATVSLTDDAGFSGPYLLSWGSQLEAGAFASSYIPTAGSTVTRAADVVSFTIPSGVSTLRYTFDDDSTQDVSVSPGAFSINTATLNRLCIKTIVSV